MAKIIIDINETNGHSMTDCREVKHLHPDKILQALFSSYLVVSESLVKMHSCNDSECQFKEFHTSIRDAMLETEKLFNLTHKNKRA